MKAYKIVSTDGNGHFYSFFYKYKHKDSIFNPKTIKYYKNKEVFRQKNCGPLACFETLEDVIYFFKYNYNIVFGQFEIWSVDIIRSKEDKLYHVTNDQRYTAAVLPHGTILADSLKYIKVCYKKQDVNKFIEVF